MFKGVVTEGETVPDLRAGGPGGFINHSFFSYFFRRLFRERFGRFLEAFGESC